jgi:hypothetical protein
MADGVIGVIAQMELKQELVMIPRLLVEELNV